MVRLGLDVTPLAVPLTGIGRFVRQISAAAAHAEDIDLVPISLSGRSAARIKAHLPAGVGLRRSVPARPLLEIWRRVDHPTVGRLFGPVDLVHGTNFYVPPPGHGTPELLTVHDLGPWDNPDGLPDVVRFFPELTGRAVRRGAHVHTLSHAAAAAIADRLTIPAHRLHPIPIGFDPVPDEALDGDLAARLVDRRYVLALGSIEPRKRVPELVEALAPVLRASPGLVLVVAGGPGGDSERLLRGIADARIDGQIVLTGYVTDEVRGALLRSAAVVVSAATTEGFGMVPAEAMSVGTPVVATDIPAHREVCDDGALLVPSDQPEAWADAVAAILDGDEYAGPLRQRGIERARQFTWEAMTARLLDLYRSLARSGAG